MLRALTCTLALAFLMSGLCLAGAQTAQDKDKDKGQEQKATITKLDAKNHSITLKMRDKSGKETERNFRSAQDIHYSSDRSRASMSRLCFHVGSKGMRPNQFGQSIAVRV